MKKLAFLVVAVAVSFTSMAQDDAAADSSKVWTTGGMGSLTFTQTALFNWAGGGQNSIAGNAFVNLFANYKKGKSTWDNNLDMGYGLIKQGEADLIKGDDRIELSSKYGQYAFKHWYYTGLLTFRTQFDKGYDLPGIDSALIISDFLAPAYLQIALGMDYKPSDNFSFLIAPLTGKVTIVNNQTLADAGAFGVEAAEFDTGDVVTKEGKRVRTEFGGSIRMMYKRDIVENVSFQTKLDLFSNYLENPQNIDVNWEVLIGMKINKYMSANISTMLVYDDDIDIVDMDDDTKFGPRTQFREIFGLGLSYKF